MSKEESQPSNLSPERLTAALNRAEEVRSQDKFKDSLAMAERELAPFRTAFENLSFQQLALVAKIARLLVSSADSAAKRTPFPEAKVDLFNRALDGALEPFYKNKLFIDQLTAAIQNPELKSDERHLLIEMWRDIAKIVMSASVLYKDAQSEELVRFSRSLWEGLHNSLEDAHPEKPFISIEQQLFLHSIGQTVHAELLVANMYQLRELLIDSNLHRLGTMAIRLVRLGQEINNQTLVAAAQQVFDEVKGRNPAMAKRLESPLKPVFARVNKIINEAFVPLTGPTESKSLLHERLLDLKQVPFFPAGE